MSSAAELFRKGGGLLATGIGSLPHPNVDSALEWSFKLDVPFVPQIPVRRPKEYMIVQALEGMPGLRAEDGGFVSIDPDEWSRGAPALEAKLDRAFASAETDRSAFEPFEPSAEAWGAWKPFLWEAHERRAAAVKAQIAGPLTCQWALRFADGSPIDRNREVTGQVLRLVTARAIAMSRRLASLETKPTPIIYLDEPGLYGFSRERPRHAMGLQELKLVVQSIRREGVLVGIHCCSDTDWEAVLSLGLDFLSLDTGLSLASLLLKREALEEHLWRGGRLSLGVIPTGASSRELRALDPREIFMGLMEAFSRGFRDSPELVSRVLQESLYTPACGLGLHSPEDTEAVLEKLLAFKTMAGEMLARSPGKA